MGRANVGIGPSETDALWIWKKSKHLRLAAKEMKPMQCLDDVSETTTRHEENRETL